MEAPCSGHVPSRVQHKRLNPEPAFLVKIFTSHLLAVSGLSSVKASVARFPSLKRANDST